MNYERIYRDFIASRKAFADQLEGYTEKHHIVPKALGGGDEPENLVRLTPEDHYFAHLLLAKIHGGSMWAAVYAMCYLGGRVREDMPRNKITHRIKFGHVRRSLANYYREINSGPDSPTADKKKYVLRHFDGREVRGNRFHIEAVTGVPRQQVSALLRGAKKSAHGWYYAAHNPKGLTKSELISVKLRSGDIQIVSQGMV